ncbi:hypothetical protein BH24ACT6_BH24ACT6_14620 [soil metagenome]
MTTQKPPAVPVSGIARWWEILVPDVDAAASFYATAFGWTSSRVDVESASSAGISHSEWRAGSATDDSSGHAGRR